jgi:hypothetical protein
VLAAWQMPERLTERKCSNSPKDFEPTPGRAASFRGAATCTTFMQARTTSEPPRVSGPEMPADVPEAGMLLESAWRKWGDDKQLGIRRYWRSKMHL